MHTPTTGRPSSSRTPTPEARPRTTAPTTSAPVPARPSFGDYHPDDVVSRKDAAALIGVSPRTTEDWARDGKGPAFRKFGTGRSARIVYRVGDLLTWLDAQRRSSTTTTPEAAR
jgi:hypothetical protein